MAAPRWSIRRRPVGGEFDDVEPRSMKTVEQAAREARITPSYARTLLKRALGGGPREISDEEWQQALGHPQVELCIEIVLGDGTRRIIPGLPHTVWIQVRRGADGVHLVALTNEIDISLSMAEAEDLRDELDRVIRQADAFPLQTEDER
jgi:hypothetical protein